MLEEEAYLLLKDKIIRGKYPAGSPLSEVAVSQELGMSRTPMRCALNRLCCEGFVVQKKGHFSAVRVITPKDIHNFFEYSLLIEEYSIKKIYENLDDFDLNAVKNANDRQRQALENSDIEEYYISNHAYHMAFIKNCDNEEIIKNIENMWEKISMVAHAGYQGFKRENRMPAVEAHEKLHQMLLDKASMGEVLEQVKQISEDAKRRLLLM